MCLSRYFDDLKSSNTGRVGTSYNFLGLSPQGYTLRKCFNSKDVCVLRVHVFHSTLLLSCVAFEFSDILSLLTLEIYITFELIHCLRACSLSKTNPGNQRVSLLSQCQNRIVGSGPELELCRVRFWGGVCFPKMELEGRFKNGTQKCEEDEIKGIQKWSRNFRDILVLVYIIFLTYSLLRTLSSN